MLLKKEEVQTKRRVYWFGAEGYAGKLDELLSRAAGFVIDIIGLVIMLYFVLQVFARFFIEHMPEFCEMIV